MKTKLLETKLSLPLTHICAVTKGNLASENILPAGGHRPKSFGKIVSGSLLALSLLSATAQAQLIHRYSFTSDGTDSVGGANATLRNSASVSGGALTLTGLGSGGTRVNSSDATGPYATLPGTVLQGLTNVTIEFWATPGTATSGDAGTWSRIYDFGNSVGGNGQNLIMFCPHTGYGAGGTSQGAIKDASTEYDATHIYSLDDSLSHHVVMVYDATGGFLEYYLDGTQASGGRVASPIQLSVLQTNNMYLGRSQYNGDSYLQGTIDEFRIWNRPLSGVEAMANEQSGPNSATIDLSSLGAISAINFIAAGSVTEKLKTNTVATADFANFSGLNIFHLPGFTLTSSDPTIATVDSSGNISALKPGTTTITGTYGSVSGSFPFTVTADTTMPVLSLSTANYDRVIQITSTKPLNPTSATTLSNYQIDGGAIVVSNATLSANGMVITLKTAPFDVQAAHSLAVNGLQDTATTPNVVNNTYAFGTTTGSVTRKIWLTSAATLSAFQAFSTFPTRPDQVSYLSTASDTPSAGNNYCDMLEGYFVPDTTGDYIFAIGSDDDGALYISTDSTVANLGATPIASVSGYINSANLSWNQTSSQQSTNSPKHLVAGSKYYFRALHRQGTGGDFLNLAMQLAGSPVTPIADGTPVIQGANLAPYFDTPVPLAFTTNPVASQTVLQSRAVSLSAAASGLPNYKGFQWYRNGQPIPGATGLTYSIANTSLTNDNDIYYAVVTNLAFSVQSGNSVLHVTPDTTAPTMGSANTRLGSQVFVTFSEPLDAASATTPANYTISGVTVTNVTLDATGTNVTLDATGTNVTLYVTPNLTTNFSLIVSNVKDLSGNAIAPGSGANGLYLGVSPGMIAYWPLDTLAGGKSPDVVSGYDMTAVGFVATNVVTGKWGNAFYFDGVATVLKHTFNTNDSLPAYKQSAHTISVWVNASPSTASANDRRIYSESSATVNTPLFNIGTMNAANSSKLAVLVRNDANTASPDHAQSSAVVFDNNWHHICIVQTASNSPVKFYIDGVLDSLAFTPSYPMTVNTTSIGAIQRASASGFFIGLIDDVAVWNRALGADEVAYLASHVTPTPPAVPQPLAINTFAISLPAVQQGGSVTMSWDVSKDADSIDIQPSIGSVMGQTVLGAGTLTLPVTSSTTYTLTIHRGVETKTAQVSVAAIGNVTSGWTLLDNFDRYSVGSLPSPWLTPNAGLHVVDVGGNRLLAMDASGALAGLPLGSYVVKEGSVATLFFRLYVSQPIAQGQLDQLIGLTDKGIRFWTDYTGDCGPSVELGGNTPGIYNPNGDVMVGTQNGYGNGALLEYSPNAVLLVTNVYNVWIDITNDVIANNDLVSMYIAQDGVSDRTVLFQDYRSDRNPNDTTFTGPTKPDLINLVVGGNTSGSLVYVDDFYLSVSNYNATVPRAYGFTIPVTNAPTGPLILTATVQSGNLMVSWPTALGSGYTLNSTTNLSGGSWSPVGLSVVPNGTNSTVTIPAGKQQEFYRLIK